MWRWKTSPRSVIGHRASGSSVIGLLVVALFLMAPIAAGAQTPGQEYGPPTDIARDSLPALPLLYTAYAFAWVALIGYVFMLWRRLARVERELADVRGRIPRGR